MVFSSLAKERYVIVFASSFCLPFYCASRLQDPSLSLIDYVLNGICFITLLSLALFLSYLTLPTSLFCGFVCVAPNPTTVFANLVWMVVVVLLRLLGCLPGVSSVHLAHLLPCYSLLSTTTTTTDYNRTRPTRKTSVLFATPLVS